MKLFKHRDVVTSIPVNLYSTHRIEDPIVLLPPRRFHSDNARIGRHTVLPFGPQNGIGEQSNNGLSFEAGARAYLEIASQQQVGVKFRTERVAPSTPWDESMVLNPNAELI